MTERKRGEETERSKTRDRSLPWKKLVVLESMGGCSDAGSVCLHQARQGEFGVLGRDIRESRLVSSRLPQARPCSSSAAEKQRG